MGIAAIVESIFFFILSDKVLLTNFPNPSTAFKNTFPVNPSVTNISTLPEKASLPSTLPIKFIFNSFALSFNR